MIYTGKLRSTTLKTSPPNLCLYMFITCCTAGFLFWIFLDVLELFAESLFWAFLEDLESFDEDDDDKSTPSFAAASSNLFSSKI